MSESYKMPILYIKYKGFFDFDGLYNAMAEWLRQREYILQEKNYKHKVPSVLGAEEEIYWAAHREVTDFYEQEITIFMHIWDMTENEMKVNGQSKMLTHARIEFQISGSFTIDYQNRWEANRFYRFLFNFYRKYIVKEEILTDYADQLYYRMYKLHALIKEILDLQAKENAYTGYLGDNV